MNYRERHNLSHSEIINSLSKYSFNKNDQSLYISCLFVNNENRKGNKYKLVTAFISNAYKEERTLIYPQYSYFVRKLEFNSYESLIEAVSKEGIFIDRDYPMIRAITSTDWREELVPSSQSMEEWPKRRIKVQVEEDVPNWNQQLIAYGLPFFKSAEQLINELTSLPEYYVTNNSDRGELIIDVTDKRGKINIKDGKLSCEGYCTAGIVGYFTIDGNKQSVISSSGESIDWSTEQIQQYELFLVTENNEVIDFQSENAINVGILKGANLDKYVQEVEKAIDSGEGEVVEFKSDIDLKNLGSKVIDLEKTVCALSNHKGGKLILGVNDDGEVKGLTSRLQKQYKNEVNGYIADIQKRLTETLTSNDCFEIKALEVRGHAIVIVEISKSKDCNAFSADNTVYIRRGASSRKASPSEWSLLNKDKRSHGLDYLREYY